MHSSGEEQRNEDDARKSYLDDFDIASDSRQVERRAVVIRCFVDVGSFLQTQFGDVVAAILHSQVERRILLLVKVTHHLQGQT